MPKIKSHSGTVKRVKQSAGGKLLRRHAFRNHFLSKKSSSRKRNYASNIEVSKTNEKKIKRLLGE
jgi:large subunit ribosomal protein L35